MLARRRVFALQVSGSHAQLPPLAAAFQLARESLSPASCARLDSTRLLTAKLSEEELLHVEATCGQW